MLEKNISVNLYTFGSFGHFWLFFITYYPRSSDEFLQGGLCNDSICTNLYKIIGSLLYKVPKIEIRFTPARTKNMFHFLFIIIVHGQILLFGYKPARTELQPIILAVWTTEKNCSGPNLFWHGCNQPHI